MWAEACICKILGATKTYFRLYQPFKQNHDSIFQDMLGCLGLLSDEKLSISSIPWNRTSKDENNIEAFMLTQDKNLRCVATLTSKRKIASLGNSPFVRVLPPGRFKWVIMGNIKCVSWEISFCSKVPVVWFV